MVIYKKEDAEMTIPNGIGNLNITITNGGGDNPDIDLSDYATINYVDNKNAQTVDEVFRVEGRIDEIDNRVTQLENNGGGDNYNTLPYHIEIYCNVTNDIITECKLSHVVYENFMWSRMDVGGATDITITIRDYDGIFTLVLNNCVYKYNRNTRTGYLYAEDSDNTYKWEFTENTIDGGEVDVQISPKNI